MQSPEHSLVVHTGEVEIIHFIVPAGVNLPTHEAQGEIVLHCLEGRLEVLALREVRQLVAGQLLYLAINEPFSMRGIEDSSLLATIVLPKQGPAVELLGT
jgi:quercetin dioxygenase-like cupin family protein